MRNWLQIFMFLAATVSWSSAAAAQSNVSASQRKPIATIAGKPIYEEDLPARILGQLQEARQREYELAAQALQEVVRERLLKAEAEKKGLGTERLLQQEVDDKIPDPTPGEVDAFYLALNDRNRRPTEADRLTLKQNLKQAKIQAARDAFLDSLQRRGQTLVLLKRPRVNVTYDPSRLKGNHTASVIIVEFSDFSCPFCHEAESTLNALLAKYEGRLGWAYRDFPLRQIHPQAELAAEASRCAAAGGKYWEYHDLLFKSGDKLKRDDLLQFARELALDDKRFTSCLDTAEYSSEVEQDLQDGLRAGVSATPAFFINGVFLKGAQSSSSFEEIIDQELAN